MSTSSKKWYQSKTVWFNILTIATAIVSGVSGLLPLLEIILPPVTMSIALFTVGVLNIILRSITKGPIDWKQNNVESS